MSPIKRLHGIHKNAMNLKIIGAGNAHVSLHQHARQLDMKYKQVNTAINRS